MTFQAISLESPGNKNFASKELEGASGAIFFVGRIDKAPLQIQYWIYSDLTISTYRVYYLP